MHNATRKMATVASTYASQVPLPARAHTSGIVAAGVVVGAMVETDWAKVSKGDKIPRRNPKSVDAVFSTAVRSISSCAPSRANCNWAGIVQQPSCSDREDTKLEEKQIQGNKKETRQVLAIMLV